MDDIFDTLSDFMDENKNIIDIYDEQLQKQSHDIMDIAPIIVTEKKNIEKKSFKRIKPIRCSDNLLIGDFGITTQNLFEEDYLMTTLVNTTNTLEGKLMSLTFMEEEMIKLCYYTDDILDVSCNYGNVRHPDYYCVKKLKKKKVKAKKRKEQGNGSEFNSQITFTIKAQCPDAKPYKFKVFRPGQIQLPGAKIYALEDIIRCCNILTQYINTIYERTDIELVNLSAVMKNYRCEVKLPPGELLYLMTIKELLLAQKETNGVFMVKYGRQDSKLAVIFNTPTPTDTDKKARINIFMSGKINILGGYDVVYTKHMYNVIYNLIKDNYNKVVIRPNDTYYAWKHNVDEVNAMELLDTWGLYR